MKRATLVMMHGRQGLGPIGAGRLLELMGQSSL